MFLGISSFTVLDDVWEKTKRTNEEREPMLLLIDNYDSFTYNLYHFLSELGAKVQVARNDSFSPEEALALQPKAIVLSPGPCTPDQAGMCLALLGKIPHSLPVLGVCLGCQVVGQAFGGRIRHASKPMHGKCSTANHNQEGLFARVANPLITVRYHSLIVERATFPQALEVIAEDPLDQSIMALKHRTRPIYGVQFHPESIAAEDGQALLANFLGLAGFEGLSPVTQKRLAV